jgi:sodium transport system permease protein
MLNRVPAIYRKEILDMIRDRRTIVSMVVVPILVIPMLFLLMGKLIGRMERKASAEAVTLAVRNADKLPGLRNALAGAKFEMKEREDIRAAVTNKVVAAAVEPVETPAGLKIQIYTDDSRPESEVAGGRLQTALAIFKENSVKLKLMQHGISEVVLTPFTVDRQNVAPKKRMAGTFFGGMLAYLVVLLMFSGGMYPAIDLTAGEKERRTLEVVLSSPAGRQELILGKILATTTAVFATALLTVSSLLFSFRYMDFGTDSGRIRDALGGMQIDAGMMGMVLAALFPTAIMGASLMIAIALFAKSFKEAQSYLTPFISVIIFPLIVGMMPGVSLTPYTALIPLFNVCQLVKEVMQGEPRAATFAVVMASNLVYAAVAFFAAVQVFKSEKVLFRT